MGIQRRRLRRPTIAAAGTVAVLATAGSAFALQGLPPGVQVNNDPAAGINPALNISGEDPANADVVGGALTAGKVAVPWAILRQTEATPASPNAKDQIFSRSFAGGAWTTRGIGTVGGSSSAAPTFSGSLNFDQNQDGEAPAIDFAGAGRTVPWATWYEKTTGSGFGANNIFASRFDNTGDANQGKWIFAGQGRGPGGANGVDVPSLNIHTNQDAENPSVAGGNAGSAGPPAVAPDPTKPGPWITWQETSTQLEGGPVGPDQIFVERPIGPGSTNCSGVKPGGGAAAPHGGFCWQQTGIDRFGTPTLDPSLNIDPTRNGIEPDIAFTGASDSVPWVVWYEKDPTQTSGPNQLKSNEMVFAAKGVTDGTADGGIHWQAVGNHAQGTLDTSGTAPQNFGSCAVNAASEANCTVNADPNADGEDPRVSAGTMNPANPTVPWIAWDEGSVGHHRVFVSRLVGAGAAARFVVANSGQPISPAGVDATRPDITFSGNTPYVTWRTADGGGNVTGSTGHFVNAANPTFVADNSAIPLSADADVREPISSGCTANPFNSDGAACQGAAVGTPFFLFTNTNNGVRGLFANAYQSDGLTTGAATGIGQSTATLNGSVNPEGAKVNVSFQFGTTTAYGQTTATQSTGPDRTADAFSAALNGLPSGTTIHYRAVAAGDFGTQVGADQTLTTQSPAPPPPVPGRASVGHVTVHGTTASVPVTCTGATSCSVSLRLTVRQTLRGHKVIAVSAHRVKVTHSTVVLGTASATIRSGGTATVKIGLNRTGRRLLSARHRVTTTLAVTQETAGQTHVVTTQSVTFRAPKVRHGGH